MNDRNRTSDGTPSPDTESESKSVDFYALSHGRNEVVIEHCGQEYRLRVTKNGKLLLNK